MNDFKHKIRRGLAVFLALTMCISLAMVPAYAVEGDGTEEESTVSCTCEVKCDEGTETACPVCAEDYTACGAEAGQENVNVDVDENNTSEESEDAASNGISLLADDNAPNSGIISEDALTAAINDANGNEVKLDSDITLTKTLTIKKTVTLNLNGHTLSGDNKVSVLTIDGGDVTLTGDGTITGGNGVFPNGGGVTVTNKGSFTMENGTITKNTANTNGGGVFVHNGTFTMHGGTISDNNGGYYGGGVFVYNSLAEMSATFTMNGGTISGNHANAGGGIGASGSKRAEGDVRTVVTIIDGIITGNKANNGAGIGVETVDNSYSTGTTLNRLEITGGTISGNEAVNYGGGVYTSFVDANISDCDISGNKTTATTNLSNGGGVHIGNGNATLKNVIITGNNAVQGGGIFGTGPISLENCSITENTATSNGGGLRLGRSTAVTMTGGKLYGNSATSYGADVSCVKSSTLVLPAANTMDGTLGDKSITGWYEDNANSRWSDGNITPVNDVANLNGDLGLIAAYDSREPVAKIGETMYTTLQAAFDAAASGDTVEVLKNTTGAALTGEKSITVNIPEGVTVHTRYGLSSSGKPFTYSLVVSGKGAELTITGKGTVQGSTYGAVAQNEGTLNVTGCEVKSLAEKPTDSWGKYANSSGLMVSGAKATVSGNAVINGGYSGISVWKNSTLEITGGNVAGTGYGIAGNGSSDNTTIIISGGTIRGTGITTNGLTVSTAIFHPQVGNMTISGGEITGMNGVQYSGAGTLNITGGKITATYEYTEFPSKSAANNDGSALDGAALSILSRGAGYQDGDQRMTVNISGGELTSEHNSSISVYRFAKVNDVWVANNDEAKDKNGNELGNYLESLSITGGTFTGNPEKGVLDIDSLAMGAKHITGGYFNQDIDAGEINYVDTGYASHPVSTPEGYYNVHVPNQSGMAHDDNGHWWTCTGHDGCTVEAGAEAHVPHVWNDGVVTTQPQVGVAGVRTFTCTVCGHTRTEPIDALSGGGGGGGGGGGSTTPTPPPTTIVDPDVPLAGAPGLNSVDHFAYLAGYPDGTVRPTKNITRAEAATIFLRLMTEDFRVANWSTTHSFADADAGEWFNTALSVSAKADILRGYSDGTVKPNAAITRAEFATIAARFLGEDATDEGVGDFSDTGSHWAAKDIRRAAKAGWIKGDGNSFRPDDSITRAEVVTIVNRMLDRIPDAEQMLPEMKTWSDNPVGAWYYADVQEASNDHAYERGEDGVTEHWTELTAPMDWNALEAAWIANNGASAPKTDGE